MDVKAASGSILYFFKSDNLAPMALIAGIIMIMFVNKRSAKTAGTILMGFGILFVGLMNMSASVAKMGAGLSHMLVSFEGNPALGFGAGVLVTGIIQSSSAVVGILQSIASTVGIKFCAVFPVIIGVDIGDCITTYLVCRIGAKPEQISRQEAYNWIEQELLTAEPDLMEAKAMKSSDKDYGRATKGACWMLLARLYLNAEVYTGQAQWAKAAEYANKVINANYQLNTVGANQWSAYQMLFMADNGESSAAYEAVFPILQDGSTTTSWGGALFCIASTFDGKMHANPLDPTATNNTDQAWGGNRARPELVLKFFPNATTPEGQSYDLAKAANDDRALFCSEGRSLYIDKPTDFLQGFGVAKWTNFRSDNAGTKNASFPDTDFFLFRLAEAYLTVAEADARQNGGTTTATGTELINRLRQRANATTKNTYTLDNIIDEWAREFYYEGRRRVDLIRFGLYGGTNSYKWQWKGGAQDGTSFSADLNIYAIPSNEIATNSNLKQNPGYK